MESQDFFVSLQSVRGEIRTNESIRYYFALSQEPRKLVWNNKHEIISDGGIRIGYSRNTLLYAMLHAIA